MLVIIIKAIKFQVRKSLLHSWGYSNFSQRVGGQGNSFTGIITDGTDIVYKKETRKS